MLELIGRASADLIVYLPAVARVTAMLAVAPGFSFQQVPPQVRVFLAFALALAIAPLVPTSALPLPHQPVAGAAQPVAGAAQPAAGAAQPTLFVPLLLSQALLGALIGLIACLLIETVRYAGSFVELQAGLRAAEMMDPAQATPTSLLGHLYYFAAVVLFFDLDGHHLLLAAVHGSFQALPVAATAQAPASFCSPVALCGLATDILSSGFLLALSLAMPVVAALLLTDLSFGLVARLVPRFNIFFVSLPAKMGVSLAGLAISAPLLARTMAQLLGLLTHYLRQGLPSL